MKTILLLPTMFAAFVFAAPSTNGPDAASPPRSANPGENNWAIDAGHSSVMFRVKHANVSWFQGTFDGISGMVTIDPKDPSTGSVTLTIPVDKVDTNDQKRDEHLKGPDFFASKENPDITFKSTKIAVGAGGKLNVTGDLAMAGKSKSMTIEVEKTGEGDFYGPRIGWWTTFTIKRSDFGMDYGVAKNQLGDEVMLSIGLETTQAK